MPLRYYPQLPAEDYNSGNTRLLNEDEMAELLFSIVCTHEQLASSASERSAPA